jgi:hypothetical protein
MTSQQEQHESFCTLYRDWKTFIADRSFKSSIRGIVYTIWSNLLINAFDRQSNTMKEMLKRIDEITSMPYEDISTVYGTGMHSNYEEATKAVRKLTSISY